jgi:FdhD protein
MQSTQKCMLMKAEYSPLKQVMVEKCQDGEHVLSADIVAEEVPVALVYNSISHVVMLASPQNLEDFALGFSISEGILQHPSELLDCYVSKVEDGIHIDLHISEDRCNALKEQRRNLIGRSGCGLCGAETLKQVIRNINPVNSCALFSAEQIYAGFAQIQLQQNIQRQTGGTHAAGWLNAQGKVEIVREDVGRHNSLDKLLGALLKSGQDLSSGGVLITSRASYEMVQKSATAGIGFLAAISAPTGLAIRLAEQTRLTLLGFVRPHSHVIYTQPQRIRR